ncbi:hypothetical protein B0A48_11208 [Cryoendolithus antarcticus]|uniref:Efflux pump dotC n=1 Tax=Cryoendolithus antarcticus TaxID=1507870 RepID=A0A1V8SUR4_9PEZI|nr:hypothetical protein B0A48_11208 [Cryoendolithus antarcticus]
MKTSESSTPMPEMTDTSSKASGAEDAPVVDAPVNANADLESGDEDLDKGAFDDKPKHIIAVVMIALSLAAFLAALDSTIVATALPAISEHFQSSSGYTWIGSAYLLASAASTPLWGKLADIFSRKPTLLFANVVFLVGSLVAGLANSIGMLIAARAVQGIGGAGLLTLVDIVICDMFSLRTRGAYLGMIGGVWALACALGPLIGGAFTQEASWRWCFYINLPLDGIAFFIVLFFLKIDSPRTPIIAGFKAIDWLGTLTISGGTLMFLLGLQYGGVTHPWASAIVLCLIIFGLLLAGLFLLVEWKFAKYPLIPFSVFATRSNGAAVMFAFIHGLVFIAEFYYLPLYFQIVKGAKPLLSGVYILPSALGTGLAAAATGGFIAGTGKYLPPIYFGAFMTTLGYGLLINFGVNTGWAKLVIFQLILGVGVGPNFQAPLVALQAGINPRDIATSTATFNFVRTLATSISVVLGQVVFQNQMKKKGPMLVQQLGPELARQLGGADAAANAGLIDALPAAQKLAAQTAFAKSLSSMWIMYCGLSVLMIICAAFIGRKVLTREHQVQEVGLEAEKRNAAARKEEERVKKQAKVDKKAAKP